MVEAKINSILAADCGSTTTIVALIDLEEGKHRLITTGQSPSTHGPPWHDITVGVQEAIRQIERATKRTLLTPGGRPITPRTANQDGVDAFVAVASAAPPLRVTVVGLMESLSLASARLAAAGTYSAITGVVSLDAEPELADQETSAADSRTEAWLQTIQTGRPDVILLVGGTDGGAERPVVSLANLVAMALKVFDGVEKPAIIYAGNVETRPEIADILGPITELKAVDNVRPALDIENVTAAQTELENFYMQRKMFRLPGVQKLSNWSQYTLLPSSKSFEKVITYLGRHNHLKVLGANIGSGATTICTQIGDQTKSLIRSDAGVGHGLTSMLDTVPIEKIQRWLPFHLPAEELYNQLLNKALFPASIPTTYEELMIEYAVAREAMRLVVAQARAGWPLQPTTGIRDVQWNLIVGAGWTLTHARYPGHAAMLLLDGIEPWGVTSMALDMTGLADLLGSVAGIEPLAAVQVAAHDAFLNLATVIAPAGHGQRGKTAVKLKATYADSSTAEVEVPYGSLEIIPLLAGQKATLEMRPSRHFDIGLGQPGRGAVAEVEGGLLGIIIDARGRPLRLLQEDEERHEYLEQWVSILSETNATSKEND